MEDQENVQSRRLKCRVQKHSFVPDGLGNKNPLSGCFGLRLKSAQSHHTETNPGNVLQPSQFLPRCQRCLTWAKDIKNWTAARLSKYSFQMWIEFAFHLEITVLESGRGRVERPRIHTALKFPQAVMVPVTHFKLITLLSNIRIFRELCFSLAVSQNCYTF